MTNFSVTCFVEALESQGAVFALDIRGFKQRRDWSFAPGRGVGRNVGGEVGQAQAGRSPAQRISGRLKIKARAGELGERGWMQNNMEGRCPLPNSCYGVPEGFLTILLQCPCEVSPVPLLLRVW